MGFDGLHIQATANTDFYNREPAVASLLNSITIDVLDVSNATFAAEVFGVESVAATWMLNNQATVERWLADARLAAAN